MIYITSNEYTITNMQIKCAFAAVHTFAIEPMSSVCGIYYWKFL